MSLAETQRHQIGETATSFDEQAQMRCRLAGELEYVGQFEAARNALGDLWQGVGRRPNLEGLEAATAAEALLRAGTLSGWLGSGKQKAGVQESAKDLISESVARFNALGERTKAAVAQSELALCYWREGAYAEARVLLTEALPKLTETEQKARALLQLTVIEFSASRFNDALRILTEATPIFETSRDHALKGRFHGNLALLLRRLGTAERRQDYTDRAIVEYTAAIYHYEQAGHTGYRAANHNNLGFLLYTLGRFDEAHEQLERARRLFVTLKDNGSVARVDETRARLLFAQGRDAEALWTIRDAVRTLEKGGEQGLLVEALTTQARVLARTGDLQQSQATLRRAMELAEEAGALEDAGRAALTLIEEHAERLSEGELFEIYRRADDLLAKTQDGESIERLRACARRVITPRCTRAYKGDASAPVFVHAEESTQSLLQVAKSFAVNKVPLLISGETGTGKEILARLIHQWSGREGAFVAVNCSTLTEILAESQLFGHLEGSFTDALSDYAGAAKQAAGGTLFLDEVAELSPGIQGKLLRLLEHGEIQPIGSPVAERVDVRFVCASNRKLSEAVAQGRFRADLFYRLEAFEIEIPPLRERPEDIVALAEHFIAQALERAGKHVRFTPESLEAMRSLPLRGNARELRAIVERAVLMAEDGETIRMDALELLLLRQTGKGSISNPWDDFSLPEEVQAYEARFIQRALRETQGSVTYAARLLGFKHHESLNVMLKNRHKSLLPARTPAKKRRRSFSRK
ncbi:MAG TPA: sigma 54-interacting transcriptional regulator [Pyrinomonadaceae bacterium]|jgi:transcriptional regulator with PAS, ATPase and Fis domain